MPEAALFTHEDEIPLTLLTARDPDFAISDGGVTEARMKQWMEIDTMLYGNTDTI